MCVCVCLKIKKKKKLEFKNDIYNTRIVFF